MKLSNLLLGVIALLLWSIAFGPFRGLAFGLWVALLGAWVFCWLFAGMVGAVRRKIQPTGEWKPGNLTEVNKRLRDLRTQGGVPSSRDDTDARTAKERSSA